jgi:S-adenosylmethionine-diacylglycerol 3-amino-3-carboxypropyl transferase
MFTQSWEDPACDIEWLSIGPGETVLAITSGGDNVLEFLLEDPERIVSVDVNPLQAHLVELKVAAFRGLSHREMLSLLGVRSHHSRGELYRRIRDFLGESSRRYWDDSQRMIERGLLTQGGFERYFAVLRGVLGVLIGRRKLEMLFTLEPEEQTEFFHRHWNTLRWRTFLRVGCSKWFLGNRLDPSWFAHSDGPASYGEHFGGLARHAIVGIPARSNYFLSQIFLGRYLTESQVPRYLAPEHFETIRSRLDRLELVTADVCDALRGLPDDSVDAFALSNVFEYSPPELFAESMGELARVARTGAPITLRNLLAPRRLGKDARFSVNAEAGDRLRRRDRGFIYSHFEAARYRGP